MTKREYDAYCAVVESFFTREGLENLSQEDSEQEANFSHYPCHCCGRSQGGDRHKCNGYNGTTGEVQDGYSICPDCVYYATYGTLDDETMMSVEKDNGEDGGLTGNWDNPPEQNWRS